MSVLLRKMIYLNKERKKIWAIFRCLSLMLYKDFLTMFLCSAVLSLTFHPVEEAFTTVVPCGSQQTSLPVQFCYYWFIPVFCIRNKGLPTRLRLPEISAALKWHWQPRVYSMLPRHFNWSITEKPRDQMRLAQSENWKMLSGIGKTIWLE